MVTNPSQGALVEETVLEVIQHGQLTQWREQLIFGKNIRRFEHFSQVSDREYKDLGISPDDIKKLRNTVRQIQNRLLNTHSDPKLMYVQNTSAGASYNARDIFITKEQIKLMEPLGEGTFAVVKRAIWCREDGRKVDVAVKILRDMSPLVMEDLKVEAGHLLKLKHPNLIQLHGVVQNPAMMVFELCEGGALLDRLRDDKRPIPLLTTLLDYCLQIVKAMCYLQKEHCVHRDLAARNILLTSDEKTVKICDFGLMRNLKENEEMYIMGPQKRVPFSWCPPEALKHRKFSHASDVWAFGVTVWEIFSLGEEPWIGCRAIDVLKRLDAGERLEKPAYCSQKIYDIIATCWKVNPEHRPKFTLLKGCLQEVQFNLAEVRESQPPTDVQLGMNRGDRVIVVNNIGVTWYGQNMRTTRFGSFLQSSVFVLGAASTKPVPVVPPPAKITPPVVATDPGNSRISRPIKGSFIHTGHMDPRGGNSWGRNEGIDNIYLKNPIMGVPLNPGIPLVVPNILDHPAPVSISKSPIGTPIRSAPPPPRADDGHKPIALNVRTGFDPLRPDWGEFDAAQAPNFSPSKIDLPPVPYGALRGLGQREILNVTSVYQKKEEPSYPAKPQQPEAKPAVPTHHRPPQPPPTQLYPSHSHSVIFPNGTTAGTILIPQTRPNTPLISSQTQAKQPQPTTSASASNVLGNGFSRPPVHTQAIPRPTVDPKKNEIPIIRPLDYRNTFNGSPKQPLTPTPVPASSVQRPKDYPGMDRNRNVINELQVKLQPTGGGPSQRSVHAAPPSSSVHLNSSASDPFVVSAAVKEVAEVKRYNEAMERVAIRNQPTQHQPATNMVRPHSTIHTGSVPCLVPTPMPQAQKAPVVASHNISRPAPTVQPPNQSTVVPTKPLTVVMPEKRDERSQPSSAMATATAASAQASRPLQHVQPTPKTSTASQPAPAPTAAASKAPTPAGTLPRGPDVNRQSRIEEEIASALPPPSRLFYGPSEETSVALRPSTSSSAPPRPHSVTGVPFPSVLPTSSAPSVPQPTPVKPVDPLPISLNNVLQPIKLHSAPVPSPPAAVVSAPPRERNVDVSSIMSAYNIPPMYMNPLNPPPGYYPTQVPLFALSGNLPIAPAPPTYGFMNTVTVGNNPRAATFVVGDNTDIVAELDPLPMPSSSAPMAMFDMAGQMEVLYKEASFVNPSRCDEMVKRCDGDIAAALKELKMDYLVDTNFAPDKGRAYFALDSTNWDLNQAAEKLITG